jgi:retron-type reverse transcriptase
VQADRVAQMVVKQVIEPVLDPVFLPDSYGYRPRKSALDAVGVTRKRCWKYDWVLEFDIKGLFDTIDHELLLRAVRKHVTCTWALLYIERCLTAMVQEDETRIERSCGTPQGGVVSPILARVGGSSRRHWLGAGQRTIAFNSGIFNLLRERRADAREGIDYQRKAPFTRFIHCWFSTLSF